MAAFVLPLLLLACSDSLESDSDEAQATETFNDRVARQKKYVPAIGRHILPAPEGDAGKVALAALREADQACTSVSEATRLDSDGTIIATCAEGETYRIFKVEGSNTAFPLDCKQGRDYFGVDACDATAASRQDDETIGTILTGLKR